MAEERKFTWPQIRYWATSLSLIGAGIVATVWSDSFDTGFPAIARVQSALKELGPGIFTAGILASLVEPFFRNEFARDAFLAAFRYVLPQEFREEVEKIIRFEFIADKQLWTVRVEKVDSEIVLMTTTFERTFRNKAKVKKQVRAWYEVEDYGFSNGPTQILECGIALLDQNNQELRSNLDADKQHYKDGHTDYVDLDPDKSAKVWGKAVQYRRTNDGAYETFRDPIINPEIEVVIDEAEFDHVVTFGTLGDVIKSKFGNHYTLKGVYFPGQYMFVRWWPKSPNN